MSSVSPKTAISVSKLLNKYKIKFLDAPVSGGTNGAEKRFSNNGWGRKSF